MKFVDKLVSEVNGQNGYDDHVGIEIEMETPKALHDNPDNERWRMEHDGSLRGHGYEFVFRKPLKPRIAEQVVKVFFNKLPLKVLNTGRAGVHAHINVSDLTIKQMVNMATLYLITEDLLTNWCGEFRKGNLFCLRMRDAEFIVDQFNRALEDEDLGHLHTDKIRYASLNFKALPQYGSLEFRACPSDGNPETVNQWIRFLMKLKDAARNIDNPIQIIADVSHQSPEVYIKELFGEEFDALPMYAGWEDDMLDAVRRTQVFVYSKEW